MPHPIILGESPRRHFQPSGEGPSRGLLRDYKPSCGPSFEALVAEHEQGNLDESTGFSSVIWREECWPVLAGK